MQWILQHSSSNKAAVQHSSSNTTAKAAVKPCSTAAWHWSLPTSALCSATPSDRFCMRLYNPCPALGGLYRYT
jgi:hypothetical protein